MGTIQKSERGQLVEANDAYGSYYYLADDFGNPSTGGWTDRETADSAWEALEAGVDSFPEADVEINDFGIRMMPCAYCNCTVAVSDVPAVDDQAEWANLAVDHADDCEWILTRAHRLA